MAKNIILLSDGTGNSSASLWRTNVWRVFESLDLTDSTQVAIYDDGVGSSSFRLLAILGGAFGWGLKRNVLHLYSFLCRNYQRGDQIYAFGFSRGAFTIRVLMGLVDNQGLVPYRSETELRDLVRAAYRKYRDERYHTVLRVEDLFRFIRNAFTALWNLLLRRTSYQPENNTPIPSIRFLGLWDTVAAYGLPFDEMTRGISQWIMPLSLPDRALSDKVKRACHALSLDDERTTFHPRLWTEMNERVYPAVTNVSDERVSQVWFAGVHSNVGGGYPEDSLAHVPLYWIMNEARLCDLRFKTMPTRDSDALRRAYSARDKDGRLYDSRHGLAGYYRYGPRNIDDLSDMAFSRAPNDRVKIEWPKIHCSAIERIHVGAHGYAPIGFPSQYAIVNDDGTIVDGQPDRGIASARIEAQKRVWNRVWARRINYYLTLLVTLLLVFFPGIVILAPVMMNSELQPGMGASSWAAFLIPVIGAVGALLPRFASPWVDVYLEYPGCFTVLAALVGALTWRGSRLGQRINSDMRLIWTSVLQAKEKEVPISGSSLGEAILWFRTQWWFRGFIRLMKRHVMPGILTLLMLYAGLVGVSRVLFATGSSLGLLCKQSQTPRPAPGPGASAFGTNSLCWNSGLTVRADKLYDVIVTGVQPPWSDDSIPTTSEGFGREKMTWPMYAGLPLRRHIRALWFRPIARIGHDGTDEQVLDLKPQGSSAGAAACYVARLKPQTSGELYLFVNDAVIGFPGLIDWFYRDNHGTAQITVTEAKGDTSPPPACPENKKGVGGSPAGNG